VGQGDSIFIQTPDKKQILIDGGPTDAVLAKLGQAMGFFDRTIDLVILTHPDSDHLNGLIEVLQKYQVAQILASPIKAASAGFSQWQQIVSEKKLTLINAQAGQEVKISPGITFAVVHPFGAGQSSKDTNQFSLVGRLCYCQVCFLLPGDLPEAQEKVLESTDFNLASQVLKVAHHGSKTATGEAWLESIKPQLAIISVGQDNKFGHPSPETLERLQQDVIKILRTDKDGDIKIKTDGYKLILGN